MTNAPVTPAPAPPAAAAGDEQETDPGTWGRVLDGVGIVAGVVLVAILVDIFTDGRLISRRLKGRKPGDGDGDGGQGQGQPDGGPAA